MFSFARIARNSAVLMAQRLSITVVSVFVVGYVARSLGVADYGKFGFSLSFATLFAFLGNLGTRTVATGDIAASADNLNEVYATFLAVKFKLSVMASLLIVIAIHLLPYPSDTRQLVMIAAISQLFIMLYKIPHAVFEAHQEMYRVVFVDMTARVFVILAVVYFLYSGAGVFTVAWCYAAGNLLELFLSFYVFKKRFHLNPFTTAPIAKQVKMFRRALPFAFMGIFTILVNEIDKTMLSLMKGDVAVGIYVAAWSVYSRLLMINDSAFTAMFPAIVSLFAEGDRREFFRKISNLVVMLLGITLPIAVGITLLSGEIIDLIYRDAAFRDAANVLAILVWILPLAGVSYCFYCVLYCEEKHKLMAQVNVLPMLLNVVLNLLLIPRFTYTGAALASVLTVVIRGAAFWIITGKVFERRYVLKKLAGIVICVAAMAAVVVLTKPYNMFLSIGAAMAVYAVIVDLTGVLPVRKAVVSFLRKRRS